MSSCVRVAGILATLTLFGCDSCLKAVEVDSIPELPYPDCGHGPLPEGEVLARGDLRAQPGMLEANVVEHWELRQRDCLRVMTIRQEWPLGIADVEIIYDEEWTPIRAWKRMTLPGEQEFADIRRYEMREIPATMKQQTPDGEIVRKLLRGSRPLAIVAPGRGMLVPWIWRAHLEVGEVSRVPVLDIRGLERISDVSLRRDEDRFEPTLNRTVRVYSAFGRESVFADEHDVVIGDLLGMRPVDTIDAPMPEVLASPSPPDPVGTP